MASTTNGVAVTEFKSHGVHNIVVHINFSERDGKEIRQASVDGANGSESCRGRPSTGSVTATALYTPEDKPPSSRFEVKCHRRADEVCTELDAFFATHWPWPDEQARQKFIAADTNRWACWALPLVRDDRMLDSVKVNTLLFLLDGKRLPIPSSQVGGREGTCADANPRCC